MFSFCLISLGFFSVGHSLKMMTKESFSVTRLGKLVVTKVKKEEPFSHLNNQIISRITQDVQVMVLHG